MNETIRKKAIQAMKYCNFCNTEMTPTKPTIEGAELQFECSHCGAIGAIRKDHGGEYVQYWRIPEGTGEGVSLAIMLSDLAPDQMKSLIDEAEKTGCADHARRLCNEALEARGFSQMF